jgi:hypothetical protein
MKSGHNQKQTLPARQAAGGGNRGAFPEAEGASNLLRFEDFYPDGILRKHGPETGAGTTGEEAFFEALKGVLFQMRFTPCKRGETLLEAGLATAKSVCSGRSGIAASPACSSFDQFQMASFAVNAIAGSPKQSVGVCRNASPISMVPGCRADEKMRDALKTLTFAPGSCEERHRGKNHDRKAPQERTPQRHQ